jgi:hypothetical protein
VGFFGEKQRIASYDITENACAISG